jgi:hypothetical protein
MTHRTPTIAALALGLAALVVGAIGAQTARGALGRPAALSFAPVREVALGHVTRAMVAGRFSGGRRADLAILNNAAHLRSTSVTIAREAGGRMRLVRALRVAKPSRAIATGDLNGNGRLDLLVGVTGVGTDLVPPPPASLNVLLGKGTGAFSAARVRPLVDEWGGAAPLLIADVNGDHRSDVVTAIAHRLVVLLGRGNGTFATAHEFDIAASGVVDALAVADVNGDRKPDVIAGLQGFQGNPVTPGGTLGVLLGNGRGRFGPAVTTTTGMLMPRAFAIADLNRDGKPDLVVNDQVDLNDNGGGADHAAVVVYAGNGAGAFTQAHEYDLSELGSSPLSLVDVNGDGIRDAVVVLNSGFDVLPGDGAGGFAAAIAVSHASWTGNARLAVADYNGDGRPDVAVSDKATLSVFRNTTPTSAH